MAAIKQGITGENLLKFLESRLDNTVFRLGIAPSRNASRQLVSHKHITVNGHIVNIPSYQVVTGEVIAFKPKGANIPAVKKLLEDKTYTPPAWLLRQGPAGKIARLPERDDVKEDINTQYIIEYYSR